MLNLATVMGAFYGAEKDDISRDDAEGWVRVHKLLGAPTITERELAFALNYHSDDTRIDDADWKIARRYFEVIERNRDTHPSLATPPERAETPQGEQEFPFGGAFNRKVIAQAERAETPQASPEPSDAFRDGFRAGVLTERKRAENVAAQAKGAAQPEPADPSVHSSERDGAKPGAVEGSQWIAAIDRLPEAANNVLAWTDGGPHICFCSGRVDLWEFTYGSGDYYAEVTHWMPLPPSPAAPGAMATARSDSQNQSKGADPTDGKRAVVQPDPRIDRLKDAIEGELDGLAITDDHARAILEYVDGSKGAAQAPTGETYCTNCGNSGTAYDTGERCHCIRKWLASRTDGAAEAGQDLTDEQAMQMIIDHAVSGKAHPTSRSVQKPAAADGDAS